MSKHYELTILLDGCWATKLSVLMTIDVDPLYYVTIQFSPRGGMAISNVSTWYPNLNIPLDYCPIQNQEFPCFYFLDNIQYQGLISITTLGDIEFICNAANKIDKYCMLNPLEISYQAINPFLSKEYTDLIKEEKKEDETGKLNKNLGGILIEGKWYLPSVIKGIEK